MEMLPKHVLHRIMQTALEEDIGSGDITTSSALSGEEQGRAEAIAKSALVVAGIDVFRDAFLYLDAELSFTAYKKDGDSAAPGERVAEISGRLSSILTAERVALNIFQRMCGIAGTTRLFADAVKGTKARVLDTRKTSPGMRLLDKYAVRVGGGYNHRFGLFDGVLIKDNHIAAVGGIAEAVARVRRQVPHTIRIEVEVKNIVELEEAIATGADTVMLDNMAVEDMSEAVRIAGGRVLLEASGNVSLAGVRRIAETGVDFISVGMLTHSVSAADISLKIG